MSTKLESYDSSIIIPNYNGVELLEKYLPSVIKAKQNSKNRIREIIVVDDASTDESVKLVKDKFPQVKLIKHRENRGFSSSVNTGARAAKGEILVLINSDVKVENDFLVAVISDFKNENVFAISFHEKGYGWATGKFEDGFIVHKSGKGTISVHETFWVNGGSGAFRRDYWMKLGGMDEKLLSPYYWEDVDLCYRALKRGYTLLWEPRSRVFHEHEKTMDKISKGKKSRIQERNQLLFIWKNITSWNLFKKHIVGLIARLSKRPGYARVVIMALLKLDTVRKARQKEKRQAQVSDEAVFSKFVYN